MGWALCQPTIVHCQSRRSQLEDERQQRYAHILSLFLLYWLWLRPSTQWARCQPIIVHFHSQQPQDGRRGVQRYARILFLFYYTDSDYWARDGPIANQPLYNCQSRPPQDERRRYKDTHSHFVQRRWPLPLPFSESQYTMRGFVPPVSGQWYICLKPKLKITYLRLLTTSSNPAPRSAAWGNTTMWDEGGGMIMGRHALFFFYLTIIYQY